MRLLIVTAISTLLLISGAFAQSNSPSDTPNERAKTKTQELEKARSEAQRGNSDTKGDKQNAAQTEAVQAEHPGWYSENKPYRPCPDRSRNQWTQHLSGVPRTMSISSIVSAGEQVVRFDISFPIDYAKNAVADPGQSRSHPAGHQFCSWDGMGRGVLNGVFQNDTFNRRPPWWCLTSGRVSVGQFAGQTGCKCKQGEETG